MKKTLIAAALAALSVSAFATQSCHGCAPVAHSTAGAMAHGSNSIVSGSAASARSSGNGTSFSFGSNTVTASTRVGVSADAVADRTVKSGICTTTLGGSVNVNGLVSTSSQSTAFNISTGSGSGSAAAGGVALAQASGAGAFKAKGADGAIGGVAAGNATAHTANGVLAGTNQGGSVAAGTVSGFDSTATGSLVLTAEGSKGRFCATCDKPYADTKTATTTNVAFSNSSKDQVNGLTIDGIKLGNAQVANVTGGTANAISAVTGHANVVAKAADADVVLGARRSR